MTQKVLRILGAMIVAIFAVTSLADAAPKKTSRHRTRHSSRVTVGSSGTPTKAKSKRQTNKKKTNASARNTVKRKTTTKPS